MIEVKRKTNESAESLLRRFTRRIQQSRFLLRIKDNQYYRKSKTKRELRESAIRRRGIREKKEYLRRIGKLDETEDKYKYRGRRR